MNRRTSAKPAKAPRKRAPSKTKASGAEERDDYVSKLAAAISEVTAAQERWIAEVDAVSVRSGLMEDVTWQVRYHAALESLLEAANRLRVEPVPDEMAAVDETLRRAQAEAHMAADRHDDLSRSANRDSIVAAVRHLEHMGELLMEAHAQVPRG